MATVILSPALEPVVGVVARIFSSLADRLSM